MLAFSTYSRILTFLAQIFMSDLVALNKIMTFQRDVDITIATCKSNLEEDKTLTKICESILIPNKV